MPITLSSLISRRPNRIASHCPASSRCQRNLYFSPGGHTHDWHTIPPDRLHISLSDPVLVAAEQELSSAPNRHPQKRSIIENVETRKTAKLGHVVLRLNGGILSRAPGAPSNGPSVTEVVDPLTMLADARERRGYVAHGSVTTDSSNGSCDISEVMIVTETDLLPGNTSGLTSQNSRRGSNLAPLASETFKEELYVRGYLKRRASTSQPSNVSARKSKIGIMFARGNVFPRALGRRQGRKVAECLKAGQNAAETPGGLDAPLSEKQLSITVAPTILLATHAYGLESPGTDANTSASESYDLHEFSYITAFTTPPSSPSIAVDAETLKKGVNLGGRKHAV